MMSEINIEEYNYFLPLDKIALFPLKNRDNSKLLLVKKRNQELSHHNFREISNLLPNNSVIFLNKTKVIAARLMMKKVTGGFVEVLCIEPLEPSSDPQIAMSSKGRCKWKCIIGGKRVVIGTVLNIENDINLYATIVDKSGQDAIVEFTWGSFLGQVQIDRHQIINNEQQIADKVITFAEVLETLGKVPLPPYIKREVDENDKERYQTVYAEYEGSVAAPTAGLHFTEEILFELGKKGIGIEELILHVGPGTFKPIDSEHISEHKMHSELIIVTKSLLENLLKSINENKYIIATGTTSLRTLETLYWVGVKLITDTIQYNNGEFEFGQWDAYKLEQKISAKESIEAIIVFLDANKLYELRGRTELFIVPGYEFKIVNGLITNYHLPKSTLILLVAAFLGKELWKIAYNEALNNDYRFLSYGDASLLLS